MVHNYAAEDQEEHQCRGYLLKVSQGRHREKSGPAENKEAITSVSLDVKKGLDQ